ncbi:MAG: LysM peptidoglycan-binding domain-containing protein [Nitrospirae bacterium]|nr:LysM peptidoglycan-binding domain-containing protein [Nitrospirota bacterium]
MLNKRLILCLIITFVGISSLAFAQNQEIREYKIQQGDTLWDISKKELNDPFLWPKVWKENPEIANPDRLAPGQTIRIPLYLIQREEKTEEPAVMEPIIEKAPAKESIHRVEPPPIPEKPLVSKNLYIASGRIAARINEVGKITGSPTMRTLFGNLDFIYVKTAGQVKPGDRFYVLKYPKVITHPVTNAKVGYLVDVAGVAEIKKFEFGETVAQILTNYNDITLGDILIPYEEMTPPVVSKPFRKPDIRGYIVAARNLKDNNGLFDVVYIDRGKKDGVEIGDMFRTVFIGKQKVPSGAVQVFTVNDTSSTAVVTESTISIIPGTMIMQAE